MRRLLALAIAVVPMLWLAGPAAAATPTLHVNPHTVVAGGTVQVTGTCEPNTTGFAISRAFVHDASHDFAGVGAAPFSTNAGGAFSVTAQVAVGTAPGTYSVTGRCGGGNLGVMVALTVTAAPSPSAPTAVPAGSGGLAASDRTPQPQLLLLGGAGLLLLVTGGALLQGRSRGRRRQQPVG
jgi:hypothetical protein